MISKFIAHDSKLQFGSLNHGIAAGLNPPVSARLVATHPKADALCSLYASSVLTQTGRSHALQKCFELFVEESACVRHEVARATNDSTLSLQFALEQITNPLEHRIVAARDDKL